MAKIKKNVISNTDKYQKRDKVQTYYLWEALNLKKKSY